MAIFSIVLVAVVLHTNLVVHTAAVAGDVSTRSAGVQCRLSEAPMLCDNYSLLELPSLNPFMPAEELDKNCPNVLKAVGCVQTLTPGCRGHYRLVLFNSQKEMANIICGSRRRDFLRATKCYSVEGLDDELEHCVPTRLYQIYKDNSCSLSDDLVDCVEYVMKKHNNCTTEDVELFITMTKIVLKRKFDPNCHRSKGDFTAPSGFTSSESKVLHVKEGQTARMSCHMEKGSRRYTYMVWMDKDELLLTINDQRVNGDPRIMVKSESMEVGARWTLQISDVRQSDAGKYQCRADDSPDFVRNFTLVVHGEDTFRTSVQPAVETNDVTKPPTRKRSCTTLQTCIAGFTSIPPTADIPALCNKMRSASQCVKESLEDCRRTGFISEKSISQAEQEMTATLSGLKQMCSGIADSGSSNSEDQAFTERKGMTDPPAPTRSCADIMNCQPDMTRLQAAQDRQDFASLCEIVRSSGQCMKESLTDCRRAGVIPEEQIRLIESQMADGLRQFEEHCPDDSSSNTEPPVDPQTKAMTDPPAPTRSCADIMNCQPDMTRLQAAQDRQDFASICDIVQSSGQCMKESLADCRRTGAIPEEQIRLIESQMAAGLRQLEEHCPDDSSSNTEPPVDTQTKDLYPRPTMATHEVSTATKGQSSDENGGQGTTEVSIRAITRKYFVEEKSSSLNPGLNASSLVNPLLAWLNSGSKLNKAQEKLAVEQKFVAKLMRKKLKLDISLLKKKLNGKKV